MTQIAAFLMLTGLVLSCNQQVTKNGTPGCIRDKIKEMAREPATEPRREVVRYLYNGDLVYYIPAPCCDRMSELFDGQCRLICRPDGGFTGKGDGQCPDFREMRSDPVLLWKDERPAEGRP